MEQSNEDHDDELLLATEALMIELGSRDRSKQLSALEALNKELEDMPEERSEEASARKGTLLKDTALTLVPLLLPLLSQPDAREVLQEMASTSSPRELVIALNEALSSIQDKAEGVVVDLSDEEKSDTEHDETEGTSTDGEQEVDGVNWEDVLVQLQAVLKCYSSLVPRLPFTKSTATLLSLAEALNPVLPLVSRHASTESATAILKELGKLMQALVGWVSTTADKGGEQNSIISELLYMGITFLCPQMGLELFEAHFLETRPRFAGLHPDASGNYAEARQRNLDETMSTVLTTFESLAITSETILHNLTNPSSTSPFPSLAALHLLAYKPPSIASSIATPDNGHVVGDVVIGSESTQGTSVAQGHHTLLSDSMPVLSAGLSGTAVDAGLKWVMYLVDSGVEVPYDAATMILELLVPLAASPPSPIAQTALLKLLEGIIEAARPEDQALLLKQLIEPENPFVHIRVQALSILRQVTARAAKTKSTFLSPTMKYIILPLLFVIPSTPISASSRQEPQLDSNSQNQAHAQTSKQISILDLDATEILSTHWPTWFTECASYLWFLLELDVDDRVELRSGSGTGSGETGDNSGDSKSYLESVKKDWLDVLSDRVKKLQLKLGDDLGVPSSDSTNAGADLSAFEARFVLEKWADGLSRAATAVDRALTGATIAH